VDTIPQHYVLEI
jgi:hypothetical protein